MDVEWISNDSILCRDALDEIDMRTYFETVILQARNDIYY